jgi:hypothetical protein
MGRAAMTVIRPSDYKADRSRGYVTHSLKTWPVEFAAVWNGEKTHEVRKFDRDYRIDDTVYLYEYDPDLKSYGRRAIRTFIKAITAPGSFGLPPDIGVFSIRVIVREHVTPDQARRYCEGER